ncbi:MAG: DNA-directed RNA polymerase subunit alpha C-terminal domain-containing protein [Planctomycetota bacterium]
MGKTPATAQLDDLIETSLDRNDLDELQKCIYETFSTVDHAHERARELKNEKEEASGAEEKDLAEKRGILLYALGRYSEAKEELETVADRKEASHFLGRCCLELGEAQEAIENLEDGRSGDDDFETDMLLAHAHWRAGDVEEAEEICDSHEQSHPDAPEILCCRGKIAEARGEYGEAVDLYEECLEEDPEHQEALFRLAHNCDLNGQDDRAIELYSRCASIKPTCVGALLNLGILYEDRREYEDARDCYRRVLAIDPTHSQAQLYLKDVESALEEEILEDEQRRQSRRQRAMETSVGEFQLSEETRKGLDRLGIQTLGDLAAITEKQLQQAGNLDDGAMQELRELMARNDLSIGEAAGLSGADRRLSGSQVDPGKLDLPIDSLNLSTRSRRCMEKLEISTVGELIGHTEDELLQTPNFGDKSLEEIKEKLANLGLELREE